MSYALFLSFSTTTNLTLGTTLGGQANDIRKTYESQLRRKNAMVEQRKYYHEAEENAASDEEVRQIMDEAISQLK